MSLGIGVGTSFVFPQIPRGGGGPFEYTAIDNSFSMLFDATGGFETESIDLGLENTLCFWAKRSTVDFDGMIFGGLPSSNHYTVYINTNDLPQYRVWNGTPAANTFTNTDIQNAFRSSDWFHCAFVRTNGGADVACYINGEEKQTLTNINGASDNTIIKNLGWRGDGSSFFRVNGYLDEMAAFSLALSEETIQAIYDATANNPGKVADLSETPEGLPAAWYRMGD